jgi:hypothetical protein
VFTAVVGPMGSEDEFLIHTDLAKRHSEYMMAHLKSDLKPMLRITEHSAYHFKLFTAFLYTGLIHTIPESGSKLHVEWRLLSELWSMGHDLGSVTFKDAVVDAMIQKRATTNSYNAAIYKFLAKQLQTREQIQTGVGKLQVDIAVSEHNHEVYTKLHPRLECLEFYGEVIRGLDRIRRGVESEKEILLRSKEGKNCLYHEHRPDGVCYKKMVPANSGSVRYAQNTMPR